MCRGLAPVAPDASEVGALLKNSNPVFFNVFLTLYI
jgi:hypothetical protein